MDLGADVSFERVALKQTATLAIRRIRLQASEDGVHFTNIPGTHRKLKRTRTLTFTPVTARFLRVQIEESVNGPAGLEEVSVHPK